MPLTQVLTSPHETVASNLTSDDGSGISPSSPYHSLLYRIPWSAAARCTTPDWTGRLFHFSYQLFQATDIP
ncbi:hypothetical protein CFRS1_v005995 [Colletotrichum fructicola]|nr:hypothetical protein CFRS1_v005995 [Colletotrichum fructicola]